MAAVACGSSGNSPSTTGTGGSTGTGGDRATGGAAGHGTGGAGATGGANATAAQDATGGAHAAGGAGGTPGSGGAGGMSTPGEIACQNVGGTCKFITGCNATQGHLSDVSCQGAAGDVCCIPLGACGPTDEEFTCCSDSATFRPGCSNGQLMCIPGTTRC